MDVFTRIGLILAIIACGFTILSLSVWIVVKKQMINKLGLVIVAFGAGLGFGVTGFLATFIDDKSYSWHIIQRIFMSIEIFFWFFVGTIVVIPIAIYMQKSLLENRKKYPKFRMNNGKRYLE